MQDRQDKPRCENCEFWKKWTHITEAYLEKYPQNKDKGNCHKNAPAVAGLSEEGYTCWPDVDSWDFCGEFAEKKSVTQERQLPNRYKKDAHKIFELIQQYGNDRQSIVRELKKAGIIAKTTYWPDVSFLKYLITKE